MILFTPKLEKEMIRQEIAQRKNVFILTGSDGHVRAIQFIVGVLMLALYVWITAGVLNLSLNLSDTFKNS